MILETLLWSVGSAVVSAAATAIKKSLSEKKKNEETAEFLNDIPLSNTKIIKHAARKQVGPHIAGLIDLLRDR